MPYLMLFCLIGLRIDADAGFRLTAALSPVYFTLSAMVAIIGDGCLFVMATLCVFLALCVDKNKLLRFAHAFLMKMYIIMRSLLTHSLSTWL